MTVAKYVGLFGLPVMLAMLPKAAVLATAANPGANIINIMTQLWTMMGTTAMEFCAPGWSIIAGQAAGGIGDVFNFAANALGPAAAVLPTPAP